MYISSERQDFNIFRKSNSEKILLHSKSKSSNLKVLYIYEFIIYIGNFSSDNGDFWTMGGGSNEVQNLLNDFTREDWNDLKKDFSNWESIDKEILIEAIPFGFDKMFHPSLNSEQIPNAGDFILDVFAESNDIDLKMEISYYCFFINMSNSTQIEKLKRAKKWLNENGFNKKEWMESKISPIRNIEESIIKAKASR